MQTGKVAAAAIALEESDLINVTILNKRRCSISSGIAEQSAILCKISGSPSLEIIAPLWNLKKYVSVRITDMCILTKTGLRAQ